MKSNANFIGKNILGDQVLRKVLARRSHFWFFHLYFTGYIQYKTADFQKEMFSLTEDDDISCAVILAFRGSTKSTIFSLSYPIWSMITGGKKFILITSQNQNQAQVMLTNIATELEKNELLIKDFGRFRQIKEEWNQNSIFIPSYNCRITCISSGESMRGIRNLQYRPDLIIADDVEDLASVRTKESRDKTFNWLNGDLIPSGDLDTKIIIVGNLLHEASLIMRLKKAIEDGIFKAIYRKYPLIDEDGSCLWPGKFSSQDAIDKLKGSIASDVSFKREYMLINIPDTDRIISPDYINYYDSLPGDGDLRYIATGIDLAITQNESSDYTAMVSARVYGNGENIKIYILPYTVNEKLEFPETIEKAKWISKFLGGGHTTLLFIEEVGYQKALTDALKKQGYPAEGVKVMGQDKSVRLRLTTPLLKGGNILFPRKGCEDLIAQLTGFGYERHDDLADAFAILIMKIMEKNDDFEIRIWRVGWPL
jgi:predicted phage terminase large subunit-like protein